MQQREAVVDNGDLHEDKLLKLLKAPRMGLASTKKCH